MTQSFPTRHAKMYVFRRNDNVVVEAALLSEDNASEISNWANGAQIVEEVHALSHEAQEGLNVVTPDGKRRASVGQYVVKDHRGDFFVVGSGFFDRNYEEL